MHHFSYKGTGYGAGETEQGTNTAKGLHDRDTGSLKIVGNVEDGKNKPGGMHTGMIWRKAYLGICLEEKC